MFLKKRDTKAKCDLLKIKAIKKEKVLAVFYEYIISFVLPIVAFHLHRW